MKPNVVALVTARGGSKRLPRKNVLEVAGKPLLAWTIEAALSAPAVRSVILSTDDPEIASIGQALGADVPFIRPHELAEDKSSHVDVVLHALDWLERKGEGVDYVLVLQPTSPLRIASDIEGIVELCLARNADSAVSVCKAQHHPMLCRRMDTGGILTPFVSIPDGYLRTQDMPSAYALNGALYLIRPETLKRTRSMVPPGTLGFEMPQDRSLDIDDDEDLQIAEWRLSTRLRKGDVS